MPEYARTFEQYVEQHDPAVLRPDDFPETHRVLADLPRLKRAKRKKNKSTPNPSGGNN